MKVFDLTCGGGHRFEGWFGDEQAMREQQVAGLLACPSCDRTDITRLPSAPRLNLSGALSSDQDVANPLPPSGSGPTADGDAGLVARLRHALDEVLSQTRDVGPAFAQQALAMHHGEVEAEPIRGLATADEVQTLVKEGVDVWPLPDLPARKTSLH